MLGSQMLMGDGWILAAGDGIFFLILFLNTEEGLCVFEGLSVIFVCEGLCSTPPSSLSSCSSPQKPSLGRSCLV